MPAAGTPSTVSADRLPTWQIDGVVWSQVVVNNTVYATGKFSKARPPGVAVGGAGEISALNIFAYDIRTGQPATFFQHSLNAQGRVITASPDSTRVYVGGDFTTVDGVARAHIAAFNTDSPAAGQVAGKLNAFAPSVNNQVRGLAATDSSLFIGGNYQSVNKVVRRSLSAVTTATGSLLPWAPSVDNGFVWSMVMAPDKSRVIVGGSFTTLSGKSAYGMGSLNAAMTAGCTVSPWTNCVLPWAANQKIRDAGDNAAIDSLRTNGTYIYGGGYSYGGGGNFEGTFAAEPLTGKIILVNDCLGDTYDVLPLGQVLYSVGHAHNCSAVRSFPDTSPRVRWQRALAQTLTATATTDLNDAYGWNYIGYPRSTLLHWFPQLSTGTASGATQGPWSLAGNSNYVVLGGEFLTVNGVAQQGLVRTAINTGPGGLAPNKSGPTYITKPATPTPPTTVTSTVTGTVDVSFGTAWDYDNQTLTYDLLRDTSSTAIATAAIPSNFWTLPRRTLRDTTGSSGTTHTYRVRIRDSFGNTLYSLRSDPITIK